MNILRNCRWEIVGIPWGRGDFFSSVTGVGGLLLLLLSLIMADMKLSVSAKRKAVSSKEWPKTICLWQSLVRREDTPSKDGPLTFLLLLSKLDLNESLVWGILVLWSVTFWSTKRQMLFKRFKFQSCHMAEVETERSFECFVKNILHFQMINFRV